MALKKDGDGHRWVEMEFLVPGTPEQVWHAIATGPGMSAWFTPTSVDERVGGAIEFDFGGGVTSSAVVTEWQPPSRLGYEERDWSGDAPPLATEVVITSHSGDRCVVRMVHSLFTGRDDWDDEMETFETGWPGFFDVLRVYLRDFAGQRAANVFAAVEHPGDMVRAWSDLASAVGIAGLDVGHRYATPPGVPQLAGTVECVHHTAEFRNVMVRLDSPAPGVAVVGGCLSGDRVRLSVTVYLYGDTATDIAGAEAPRWRSWMAQLVHADSVAP
ncbi:SRPBCC domain-containing protein [Mycobacterium sp. SMC-8]|uniref:SRPBCC family protein n=1 Tax=Mycobacterium sp. SMC-8 TaxID=2857060 RepID=UPI0021B1B486|nr:SRPBCC domain-containing protein [Mycobacterium sp. SMC-8]